MAKENWEILIAKLAHDIASPLSALIMSAEMLQETKQTDDGRRALNILMEGLDKTKSILEFWRFLFSTFSPTLQIRILAEALKKFLDLEASLFEIQIGQGEECSKDLAQIFGLSLLCLNDRLTMTEKNILTLSSSQIQWTGNAKRGDLLDRFQHDGRQNSAAPQSAMVRVACAELAMDLAAKRNIRFAVKPGANFSLILGD